MATKIVSKTARERELLRYYQPPQLSNSGQPQSSHDATLTAFAQLGAQRLNAKRGIISLVARTDEYIIAEATRTFSLQPNVVYKGEDELWKGVTTVRRCDGPCSVAMDLFTGHVVGERAHLVVNDLSKDDRFSKMDPVANRPFMKFFVTVPLHSPAGFIVGTFCIVDDKSRDGVSEAEIAFMKDMARIIMTHLEAGRVREKHRRAEKMIRGIGLFVEGKHSLRDWWLRTGYRMEEEDVNNRIQRGESLSRQADRQFGVQESSGPLAHTAIRSMQPANSATSNRPQEGRDDDSNSAALSVILSDNPDTVFSKEQEPLNSALNLEMSTTTYEPTNDDMELPPRQLSNSLENSSGAQLQDAVLSDEIKQTFSRASSLIREAIAVDGSLFLDASVGTFGGSSTKANMSNNTPTAWNNLSTPFATSSSDEAHQRKNESKSTSSPSLQKSCSILGYSTSTRSSLSMHKASELHLTVPESFLRKLLLRYPHGKVFHFDEEGSLSNSEGELSRSLETSTTTAATETTYTTNNATQRKRKRKQMSREAEAKVILQILPYARCAAFFPLWDARKERWFAGSFVWTTDPTRILDPDEDLTYLASFGNSIMCEVSRLDALVNSQMKTSFISSISHELRSPLHGILASAEFLKESVLDHLQRDMVDTINSCGRTLLDTINHVLDFTKIRGISHDKHDKGKDTRNSSRRSRQPAINVAKSPRDKLYQRNRAVDLILITEEVLEAVYASHSLNQGTLIDSYKQKSGIQKLDSSAPAFEPQSIIIIFEASWRPDWVFSIDPGAWRRLVMNIFGNSLKYTEEGFVRVSLGSSDNKNSSDGVSTSMITLTIADSGKGISREFLRHNLYTPFAQEDSLATGTGLGLSIVRNIVSELGGLINVTSEQGSGTEVKVSIPLNTSTVSQPLHTDTKKNSVLQIQKKTSGLKACLIGFNVFPDIVDEPTGILSVEAERMFSLKDSLTSLMTDWFEMDVALAPTLDQSVATVSFIMDSTFRDLVASGFLETGPRQTQSLKPILLVLCSRYSPSYSSMKHEFYEIVYLQQPIGPCKMAKALTRCLMPESVSQLESYAPNIDVSGPFARQDRSSAEVDDKSPNAQSPAFPDPDNERSEQGNLRAVTAMPIQSLKPDNSQPPGLDTSPTSKKNALDPDLTNASSQSSSYYVLLVEDNPTNLKLLVAYMRKLGIDYDTAENGLIAVRKYKASPRPFDFIFLDISMPVMDGLAASREIRLFETESKRPRTVIVAITGAASQSARQEAFGAGIDQFLIKPVPMKILKQIIDDATSPQLGVEDLTEDSSC